MAESKSWITIATIVIPLLSAIAVAYITSSTNGKIAQLQQQTQLDLQNNQIASEQNKLKSEQDARREKFMVDNIPKLLSANEAERKIGIALLRTAYPSDAPTIFNALAEAATGAEKEQLQQAKKESDVLNTRLGAWVIVTGGDVTLDDALPEVKKAGDAGYDPVAIYKRSNYFRTVIGSFPDRQTAERVAVAVRARVKDDAYVVSLNTWCPNAGQRSDAKGNYWECPSP